MHFLLPRGQQGDVDQQFRNGARVWRGSERVFVFRNILRDGDRVFPYGAKRSGEMISSVVFHRSSLSRESVTSNKT
jgi:hypothetical protein